MANLMVWHSGTGSDGEYVGETADGREVHVDGDEISEAMRSAAKADGVDLDALFESDREAYNAAYDKYRDMQLNPDDWAGLDLDGNQFVHTYCALCGCHSAVPESAENGTPEGCQCECHEDGIARGKAAVIE